MDLLTQELRSVQHKWESIGEDYFISEVLDEIHDDYSNPDVCLREMFRKRLQPHYTPITWRNIVDSLRSPGTGQSQLADELEAKYCPSEFTNNNILLYFSEYNAVQHYT